MAASAFQGRRGPETVDVVKRGLKPRWSGCARRCGRNAARCGGLGSWYLKVAPLVGRSTARFSVRVQDNRIPAVAEVAEGAGHEAVAMVDCETGRGLARASRQVSVVDLS